MTAIHVKKIKYYTFKKIHLRKEVNANVVHINLKISIYHFVNYVIQAVKNALEKSLMTVLHALLKKYLSEVIKLNNSTNVHA